MKLILSAIAYSALTFAVIAGIAAAYYFGIPYVTGYSGMSYGQYLVTVVLVLLTVSILRSGRGE